MKINWLQRANATTVQRNFGHFLKRWNWIINLQGVTFQGWALTEERAKAKAHAFLNELEAQ